MDAIVLFDILDDDGILLVAAGTRFEYDPDSSYQFINGELIYLDDDEFQIE